ncbi:MAG TPA: hypothetical protein PK916_04705 [Bacteroidota bacterium]|nr:hypothetical protein [Bacteroidota bacterium]
MSKQKQFTRAIAPQQAETTQDANTATENGADETQQNDNQGETQTTQGAAAESPQNAADPSAVPPNPAPSKSNPDKPETTKRMAAVTLHVRTKYGKDFRVVKLGTTQAVITDGKITPKIDLPVDLHRVTD